MNFRTIYMLLFFIFFVLTESGCKEMRISNKQQDVDERIDSLEENLSVSYKKVVHEVDSALPLVRDSLLYYKLLVLKTSAFTFLSELDSMNLLLQKAERYCSGLPNTKEGNMLASKVYALQGVYYSRLSSLDTAGVYFKKAYTFAQKAGHFEKLPAIAVKIGDTYVRRGSFDIAASWYWAAISFYERLKVPEEKRLSAYMGLAQVHMGLHEFDVCDSLFNRVGKYYDALRPYEQHSFLKKKGNLFYYRKDYPSALKYYKQTLKLLEDWPDMEYERNWTHVNLGEVYLLLHQSDSAHLSLKHSYRYFKKVRNKAALYYIDTQLIALALQEGNLPLARLRIARASRPEHVSLNLVHLRNKYLQLYYEQTGDFKDAYRCQRDILRVDDSLSIARVSMQNAEIALRYRQDSLLMQNRIVIREQENKVLRLRLWVYVLCFSAVTFGALAWGILLYRRRKNERRLWQIQTALNSQRLNNIRNRISPHFIFNVLNHEMSLCTNDVQRSNLFTLVQLIRRNLELTDKMSISLAEELDFVNDYLKLEKKTLGDGFKFVLNIDDGIDLNAIIVPSMSLHLLVDNAVKHSLRMKEGKRRLWLYIGQSEEYHLIKLTDNGGGFKMGCPGDGTGTGLRVVTQTIQLFNQCNKEPLLMDIQNVEVEDGEIGCQISYSIPKNYSFKFNG